MTKPRDDSHASGPDRPAETGVLFDELCELSAAERKEFLERRVPDAAVRSRLVRLLDHFDSATPGMEGLPDLDAEGVTGEVVPERIGRYSIRDVLGSGGMGVVYLAEQDKPSRRVAVKVLRGQLGPEEHARRFGLEAELLGRLQHPGIAQILEFGTEGEGDAARAYLALEYVDGQPLTEFAREAELDQAGRLRLLGDVAEAVHHAHVRGVVHRDLKPSNILVTRDGQVKVIDFGVARATDREQGATLMTRAGEIVGTLSYMSPEQVRGEVDTIDTRADVYALGVLAYELLAGRLPLDLSGVGFLEAARVVCEEDPPRLGRVAADCRGDLEWIVAHALKKEPERRYQSAAAMAQDLGRFLRHEPVEARPVSAVYQLRKITRRYRAVVSGALATLIAILIGAGVALHYAIVNKELAGKELAAREKADENAEEAERQAEAARENEEVARELALLAEQRAATIEAVSAFREDRLGNLYFADLGLRLVDTLAQELRAGLERSNVSEEEIADELAALEEMLRPVNVTDLAVGAVRRTLVDGAHESIDEELADRPVIRARLLQGHGRFLDALSMSAEAEEALRDAVELGRLHLGPEHDETVLSQLYLARALSDLGEMDEAAEMIAPAVERALAPGDTRFGGDLTLGQAAFIADQRGDTARADELFETLLDRHRTQESEESLVVQYLAIGLAGRERYDEAEELLQNRLLSLRIEEPPDEAGLVYVLHTLGTLFLFQGRDEAAEPMLREALLLARRQFGARHIRTTDIESHMAARLVLTGEHEEGLALYRRVRAAYRHAYGDDHVETLTIATNIAFGLFESGRPGEAAPVAEDAHERALRALGPDEHETARAAWVLWQIYVQLEKDQPGAGYAEKAAPLEAFLAERYPDSLESGG